MTRTDAAGANILLLDDDPVFCSQLADYLGAYGFNVTVTHDSAAFAQRLADVEPDLIILDQRLNETTGTDVLRELRSRFDTPCIVVTGASDLLDRVVNLEIGADDEVAKSVPPRELLARIRVRLRRSRISRAPTPKSGKRGDGWMLSHEGRVLLRPDGRRCPLTTAEFDLLRVLDERRGTPVSRQELMLAVFGRDWKPEDRAVDTVVRKLRRKIAGDDGDGGIKTVRPKGYVFVGFPENAPPNPDQ